MYGARTMILRKKNERRINVLESWRKMAGMCREDRWRIDVMLRGIGKKEWCEK